MHACKSPLAVYNMVESGCGVSSEEKQELSRKHGYPVFVAEKHVFDCVFPVLFTTIRDGS